MKEYKKPLAIHHDDKGFAGQLVNY